MDGFHTEPNKIRYLRNSVLDKKWATISLKNISTNQYNFDKLVMALNESIQLEHEIEKESTSLKKYYTIHPKDIHKYDSSHTNGSGNNWDYRSQRYNDSYIYNQGYQRDRSWLASSLQKYYSRDWCIWQLRNNSRNSFDHSHSPSRFRFGDRRSRWNNEYPRTSPSLCNMSCIGCGSSQHTITAPIKNRFHGRNSVDLHQHGRGWEGFFCLCPLDLRALFIEDIFLWANLFLFHDFLFLDQTGEYN